LEILRSSQSPLEVADRIIARVNCRRPPPKLLGALPTIAIGFEHRQARENFGLRIPITGGTLKQLRGVIGDVRSLPSSYAAIERLEQVLASTIELTQGKALGPGGKKCPNKVLSGQIL
jgi:hypothetical protein